MTRLKRPVKVIPPNKPEAGAEAPRLLPLSEDKAEHHNTKLQHYLNLGDVALGTKKKRKSKQLSFSLGNLDRTQ
jgi:hypothetical protein